MSKLEVNTIEPQCGTTLTIGKCNSNVAVPSNVVKTNAVQAADGGSIISQSGTTITITITNHGLAVGDEITIDYTSGTAVDGVFVVVTSTDSNTFTVTAAASLSTNGNVSVTLSGARQYVCESWSKSIPYNNRATIQTTFREVFEP